MLMSSDGAKRDAVHNVWGDVEENVDFQNRKTYWLGIQVVQYFLEGTLWRIAKLHQRKNIMQSIIFR